jgi:hypothetical protein
MQKKPPKWIGLLFVLAAVPIFFASPMPEAPKWAVVASGIMFAFAGLSITFSSYGKSSIGKLFGLAALIAFLAVFNYAGFGPGPRTCKGGLSILGFAKAQGPHDCKVYFQVGAVVLNVLSAVIVWYNFVRKQKQKAS